MSDGTHSGGRVKLSYSIERLSPGCAYVYLPNHPRSFRCVARTVEVTPGVMLDLDASGAVIGIEVLADTEEGTER